MDSFRLPLPLPFFSPLLSSLFPSPPLSFPPLSSFPSPSLFSLPSLSPSLPSFFLSLSPPFPSLSLFPLPSSFLFPSFSSFP
ncbi:hypothetical protein ACXWRS_10490, partial [Streptococcus pyogenes]